MKTRRGIGIATSMMIGMMAALAVGIIAVTVFSNGISTTTVTQTTSSSIAASTSTCEQGSAITNLDGEIIPTNSTTDCGLGLTLGLQTVSVYSTGQNETFSLSVGNDLTSSRNVTYTGFPSLPQGLNPSSTAAYDYIQPLEPACGTSGPVFFPGFMAVYNGTGALLQLSDSSPSALICVSNTGDSYHFEADEVLNTTIALGGYWTSTDASEPWLNATYHELPLGNYTVVAFDPWHQMVELSFSVVNPTYHVTFQQVACEGDYVVPWSVTLGNQTIIDPANDTMPPSGHADLGPDANTSTITFTVSPGTYPYNIAPSVGFQYTGNTTGAVTITNSSVLVQVDAECHP